MFGLGFGEILIILVVALIFIGPKKLPEIAKGLGKGMRDFQKALSGETPEQPQSSHQNPQQQIPSASKDSASKDSANKDSASEEESNHVVVDGVSDEAQSKVEEQHGAGNQAAAHEVDSTQVKREN